MSEPERRYSETRKPLGVRRLSCQAILLGEVVIDVPPESQVHRQVVRKAVEVRDIRLDPVVRLCYVEVDEPDLDHPCGDLERLMTALAKQRQVDQAGIAAPLPPRLQKLLRQGQWRVTAAVRAARATPAAPSAANNADDTVTQVVETLGSLHAAPNAANNADDAWRKAQVVALWPGLQERLYGVALDIGSTTLSAHLCDLASGEVLAVAGRMNPQNRFGEDLMSRVSWVMMHPGGEGQLTAAVRGAVNALMGELAEQAGIDAHEVLAVTIAANPIMHHLFFGLSPVELGGAPFALALDSALEVSAAELGLAVNPGTGVYALPCVAGHVGADAAGVLLAAGFILMRPSSLVDVGADAAGVLLAEALYKGSALSLVVDVGTNAEILLGNQDRLLAASSPTGTAFEGAQISCGQRAAPGAIERVRIDPKPLEPKFKVIGCDLWSDASGFAEAVAATGITGICGSGIIEVLAELYLAGVIDADGVIDAGLKARFPRIRQQGRTCAYLLHPGGGGAPDLEITQGDARQVAIRLGPAASWRPIVAMPTNVREPLNKSCAPFERA